MHQLLVVLIGLIAAAICVNGQSSSSNSIVQDILTFSTATIDGTATGFPIWILVTIVGVVCGIIILVLLILFCYFRCCHGNSGSKEERRQAGEVKSIVCQTDFLPENLNVVLTETGTMTKRSLARMQPEPPKKQPPCEPPKPKPRFGHFVEMHFSHNNNVITTAVHPHPHPHPHAAHVDSRHTATARPYMYHHTFLR